jgi:purine-binding chemotaxis protein CheW
MSAPAQLVICRVEAQRYGFSVSVVERIVRAVEVTPLPKAPALVLGAIDVEGRVLPVLNLRRRLGLPEQEIGPAHLFLVAQTSRREVVLVVDEALGVIDAPASGVVGAARIVPGLEHLQGVVQMPDGLVFVHDLEKFLSLEEERALERALEEEGGVHAG